MQNMNFLVLYVGNTSASIDALGLLGKDFFFGLQNLSSTHWQKNMKRKT